MRVVVALGGNAVTPAGATGTVAEMRAALAGTAEPLAELVADGAELVLTHGNGPQIGRILLQQEAAAPDVPPMPMDVCGAESQGQLGYLIAQSLGNALRARGIDRSVLCLVTQVVVDGRDPAFRRPSKPVGPSYDSATAARIAHETGHVYREMSDGQWRRVVASPQPVRIVEAAEVAALVAEGHLVVAGGGGGVPVVEVDGALHGVEAVVDKDRTGALLGALVGAEAFLILTEVEHAYAAWGTPEQRALTKLSRAEARELLAAGEFGEGSMAPKVEAACAFLDGGGTRAVITSLACAQAGLAGTTGTQLVP